MIVQCLECLKEFEKSSANIKRSPSHYCSRSCSAKRTNRLRPKSSFLQLQGVCEICKEAISKKLKFCKKCFKNKNDFINDETVLSDIIYKTHHRSSAFALVRSRARSICKLLGYKKCSICQYDKHIEIHHKKSISSFPDNAKLKEINSIENMIPLCPNCHWEYENEQSSGESNSRHPSHTLMS